MSARLQTLLSRAHPAVFTAVAGLAGFCAYFSMYAFRKPFTAVTFDAVPGWSFALDYKIALVMAQVVGYALSKVVGIKVVSELPAGRRGAAILGLIGASWLALVGFALIPAPWNVAMLFLNGLPLGMIWGLVFGYMEGRRVTEALGAILCASFIVSSGVVKSIGSWLAGPGHVDPLWMPAAAGALFFPLLLASVWWLGQLPAPSAADEASRVRRAPMNAASRAAFLARYGPGVGMLVIGYVLLTALRDFRDNFAAEIWTDLGYAHASAVFSQSELPVAAVSLLALGGLMAVRDNQRALAWVHGLIVAGFLTLGASALAFQLHLISPLTFMILCGAGLYAAYTPFNAVLFERLIAISGQAATAGFLIYIADASGYLGSVALLLWRNFGATDLDWLRFFLASAYATSAVGAVLTTGAALYFRAARPAGPTGSDPRLARGLAPAAGASR